MSIKQVYESERQAMEDKLWNPGQVDAMQRLLADEIRMEEDGSAVVARRTIAQIISDVIIVVKAIVKDGEDENKEG